MGCEFGQAREWNCNAALDWSLLESADHRGIQELVAELNQLYRQLPPLHQLDHDSAGFEWIDCHNRSESLLAYRRLDQNANDVIVVANFTPVVRRNSRVGLPQAGVYREIFNSDHTRFGGSGVLNAGDLISQATAHHGRECSLNLTVPPLAALILQRVSELESAPTNIDGIADA
jgi:1,4-alpha-glucan branching enzyme